MTTDERLDSYSLDAAYKPFPTFEEWASRTNVETTRWQRYTESLRKDSEPSLETLNRALEAAKRAAAVDTGAIEGLYDVDRGFTNTVAFQTSAWEMALDKKGEHVRPLFEAQLNAYDYVLDLATKAEPVSEAAIRALHEVVCKAQATYRVVTSIGPQEQTLPKGVYKALPNHVRTRTGTNHSYAPVDVTPAEMARLVGELRTEAFLAAHPVLQAAYAHYGLVVIHPFSDGNGRVARALASVFTYRAISMPIVILSELKAVYLDSLERADGGEYQDFVNFMLARSLDTIKLVDESIRTGLSPSIEQGQAFIKGLYFTRGGYPHEKVDQIGDALLAAAADAMNRVVTLNNVPKISSAAGIAAESQGRPKPMPGYRMPFKSPRVLQVRVASDPPLTAGVARTYRLWLPTDAAGEDDILLQSDKAELFAARVDEIDPTISGMLHIRLGMFAERVYGELLAELKPIAEKASRKLG